MAEMEARKLQYANTGTEALILGILTEGMYVSLLNLSFLLIVSLFNYDCICFMLYNN